MSGGPGGSRVKKNVLTHIIDGNSSITVTEIETPKGERVELSAQQLNRAVRLDAVALESLAFQTRSRFIDFLENGIRDLPTEDVSVIDIDGEKAEAVYLTTITNEFGHVIIRKATIDSTDYLELDAKKIDFGIRLNATALETVVWQTQDVFTSFIQEDLR